MKTQNMVVCIDGIFTTFNHNKKIEQQIELEKVLV